MRLATFVSCAVAGVLTAWSASWGFQRETTDDPPCAEVDGVNCPHLGKPLSWSRFPVRYFINGDQSGVAFGDLADAVEAAFSTWQRASGDGITFELAGSTSAGRSGEDRQNTLLWRPFSNSRDSFAQSTVTFDTGTGEILDVDVEFNSNFPFAVLLAGEDDPSDPRVDVQATATHEIGHVFGLDHENRFGSVVVMYFADTTGNTTHRSLSNDDRNGVRAIYPEHRGSGGGGGCTAGPAGRFDELGSLGALLWLLARRRQKRRAGLLRRGC